MAIKYAITEHTVAYPSKTLCQTGGSHIFNIQVTDDVDQGAVVKRGDFIDLDSYKEGTGDATLTAVVQKQAANGNWYLEIVKNDNHDLFLYNQPFIAEDWTNKWKAEKNYYNEKGSYVRGYDVRPGDVVEVSALGFDGTPEAGKTLTIEGKKFKVGA